MENSANNINDFYTNIFDDSSPSKDDYKHSIFSQLYSFLEKPDTQEVIKEPINKSAGEIVMMILQFALAYTLSQTAVTHLFQLVNCLFVSPILPDSRYLIDKLFNSSKNAIFHGLCTDCGTYVGIFDRSHSLLKCNFCNIDIETKNLTYNDFFVNFDVSSQISELINSNSEHYKHIMTNRLSQKDIFKDIYDGRMYKEFLAYLKPSERQQYITVNFNSDGAPLFKSSSYSIWPIFLQVNELPFHIRNSEQIVAGLWFGKNKPNMDIFLDPFVDTMNELSSNGVKCIINDQETLIKVYPIVCCVDSVARAPMMDMTLFNGKFGCPWCLHEGKWVSNPMKPKSGSHKYPLTDKIVKIRNLNDTLKHMETATLLNPCFGFKGPSPLIRLISFNIIEGFVPDPLHIFSGIGKQFSNIWFGVKGKFSGLVSKEELNNVNSIMKDLKVPCQIGRLCRTLEDRAFWKAREWENWILYYSIPIIQLVLKNTKLINHWLLLVEAFYILLKEKITIYEIDHADALLHEFVCNTELLYSDVQMTFNVHQLLHLAKSVVNWGPLWAHSTYGFESGNGDLLDVIHAAKGVHHQVCRHIGFKFSLITIKRNIYKNSSPITKNFIDQLCNKKSQKTIKFSQARYFGKMSKVNEEWNRKLNISKGAISFNKMVKNGCLHLSNKKLNKRSDNTFVRLSDGSFGNIVEFIVDNNETRTEWVLLQILQTQPAFKNHHTAYQIVLNIEKEIVAKNVSDIDTICVNININNKNFICTVPNILSY